MPVPGDTAGHYKILEPLGKGGMGEVFLAEDTRLDRKVALKFLSQAMQQDDTARRRFQNEAKSAAGLDHPFICKIYETGEFEGVAYIAMEFVSGENLEERMQNKPLSTREGLRIAAEIAEALEEAHEKGIVHRDLKPANIMLTPQGHVKVMDFGLAKRVLSGQDQQQTMTGDLTQEGFILGSLAYMSPEQARGEKVDWRSDIFSFGVILHEMLSGSHPFRKTSAVDTLSSLLRDEPPPLDYDLKDSVPELRRINQKTLAKNVDDRYQSMKHVAADLRHLNDLAEGRAQPLALDPAETGALAIEALPKEGAAPRESTVPLPVARWRPWSTWHPRVIWLAKILAIALALGTISGVWLYFGRNGAPGSSGPAKPISVLVVEFNNRTGDPVFDGTLESAFIGTLEGASFITSYNRSQARRVAADLQPGSTRLDETLAQLVAVREGINVIVSGSIAGQDGGYEVAAKAVDAMTAKVLLAERTSAGAKDAVLPAVAKLAARVRSALGDDTPESLQIAAAETFTAASLHVAHVYAMAQEHAWAGRWEEVIRYSKQAVELDPNFGRAYSALAVAHINLKRQAEAEEYYKKALSLVDRMSAREKYRTLGSYYLGFVRNYGQALETFRKLVELFPGDSAGHNNLAIAFVFSGKIPEAVAASRRAVEVSPRNLQHRLNLALFSMYASDFAASITEANLVIKENPSYEFAYLPLALSTLAQGDAGGARQAYARLKSVSSVGASLAAIGEADLEMYFGRYRQVLETLRSGIGTDEKEKNLGEMALKYVALGEARLALGQRTKALEAVSAAVEASRAESVLFPAARVLVEIGEDARARAIASSLEQMLQEQTKSYARLIEAEIALRHNRLPEAVDGFRAALNLHESWIGHFLLGKVYVQAGHFPEALAELEACWTRRGETSDLCFADSATLRYLPPLHYWLARAQEGMGMKDVARGNYQAFLKLRSESSNAADPLMPDARRRAGN